MSIPEKDDGDTITSIQLIYYGIHARGAIRWKIKKENVAINEYFFFISLVFSPKNIYQSSN
jgi:hypothetical protein